MACLAETYGLTTGLPTLPSSEPIEMIRPHSLGIMCCSDRRITQNVCQKIHFMALSIASSVSSATGAKSLLPPALGTAMSIRPNRSTVPSTMASQSSRRRTSPAMKCTRSPAPSSSIVPCALASSRPLITTLAPSARNDSAIARPMPRVPPVMHATRPSKIPMGRGT